MKIKIVTAYWMDVQGLPFLGSGPVRKERYLGSIIAYCQNINHPIICYTHKKSLDELLKIKSDFNLDNLEIKILELSEIKLHNEIQDIVNSDQERYLRELDGRGCEIMWGKFEVLERESSDCHTIFWLDAGLQHPGLFKWGKSKKYNTPDDHKDSRKLGNWWADYDVYNFKYFFNTEVFNNLSDSVKNKLVLMTSFGPQISYPFYGVGLVDYLFETPFPVAAMIGGDSNTVKKYTKLFWDFADKVVKSKILCTEEAIMKPILDMMNKEECETFEFTSFYCCEHDKFHFEEWDKSWNEPKPFYSAWSDLITFSKINNYE